MNLTQIVTLPITFTSWYNGWTNYQEEPNSSTLNMLNMSINEKQLNSYELRFGGNNILHYKVLLCIGV